MLLEEKLEVKNKVKSHNKPERSNEPTNPARTRADQEQKKEEAEANQNLPQDMAPENKKDETESSFDFDFEVPKRQKYQQNRRQKNKTVGTKEIESSEDEFSANSTQGRKIWVFISKVKPGVSPEVIKNYIAKNGKTSLDSVSVKQCEPKMKKTEKGYFMIGVEPQLKEVIYEPSFWPKGVQFQRFIFALGENFLDGK